MDTVPGSDGDPDSEGRRGYPELVVTWDEEAWKFTVAGCDRQLRHGEPRIEVLTASSPRMAPFGRAERDSKTTRRCDRIISMTMQTGEDLVVASGCGHF